jgi:hypothetical protein
MKYQFQAITTQTTLTLNGQPINIIEYALAYHAGVDGLHRETIETVVATFEGNNLTKLRKEIKAFERANPSAEVWLMQG